MATGQDLFANGAGSAPDGWTARWVTANVTWTEQAAAPGFARAATATASGRHILTLNALDSVSADVELLTKTRRSMADASDTAFQGLIARGSGAAAAENGYVAMLYFSGSTGQLRINK